jgi:hypothetical protein
MHSQDTKTRTPGIVNHPAPPEWMAFLYGELPTAQKRDLSVHLERCGECAEHVQNWRASMESLDQWALPAARPVARQWWPALRWAAAAALALGFFFMLGRHTSPAAAELAALKASVARLEQSAQREGTFTPAETIEAAKTAANDETLRLLAEFSRLQDDQRSADRQAVNLTLQGVNLRLDKLRTELETVALNTESGFEQTHENFTQLVSLSMPAQPAEPK